MGLGLSNGGSSEGGGIKPYIAFDAKAGRMFRIDRAQGGDGMWQTDKVEITSTVQMVVDLPNIRVGWINYTSQGPVRKLVTLGKEPIPPRPDDKNLEGKPAFKQAFEVEILLDKASGGGVARVFGSSAACVIEAVDALHDAFGVASEGKAGKLPIVKIASVQPVKSGQSTNYKPVFAIAGWVDRPDALAIVSINDSGKATIDYSKAAVSPPSTGSTVVPPPAPQQAATASASDFG